VVVRAIGEIDMLTAPGWRRMLGAAVRIAASTAGAGPVAATGAMSHCAADQHPPRLVCDLSPVIFFGASGLDVLVELSERTRSAGVELRVIASSRAVRRLLALTGLDRHLEIRTGLSDALMATSSTGPAR
jgi:anti-sigma B factor antagonist